MFSEDIHIRKIVTALFVRAKNPSAKEWVHKLQCSHPTEYPEAMNYNYVEQNGSTSQT